MINYKATTKNHFSKIFFFIIIILIDHVTIKEEGEGKYGFKPNTSDMKLTDKRNERKECRMFTIRNDSKKAKLCH